MNFKIKFTKHLLFFLIGTSLFAQQDAQFSQYMYNTVNINPAYAGMRGMMSIFAMHRSQWVGLDGAPVTNNISINTPISSSNVGLGLTILNDRIGPSDENNIAVDFSYSIKATESYKFSFGLKASANLLNIDFTRLRQGDLNDYAFDTNVDNMFSPNIGVGFYLHSYNTYFGLSAPNLLETKHFDRYVSIGANSHIARERINYYFIAGHVFDLSPSVKFKPSMLTKIVLGAPLQVDVSGNFMFNEKFTVGLAYRWSAALSALVGFQATDSWFIGYSYDMETLRLANYNSGSHEFFLRYELFNRYDKVINPSFF